MSKKSVVRCLFSIACGTTFLLLLYFFGCFYRFSGHNERAPQILNLYLIFISVPLLFSLIGVVLIFVFNKEKDAETKLLLISLFVLIAIVVVTTVILIVWKSLL
jgi:hypothetical protein